MKKTFYNIYKACLLTGSLILVAASLSFGQAPGSGGPKPQEEEEEEDPNTPPTGVPIDGGATLLLTAGAGYGVKKLRDKRKAQKPLN
ncbi:PID-CTERM protein-sorting domain-containing protein [Rufibacter roseolus]|uniref:PID-CTERM protein-sorting domain-containing protein n=1 Tax=Rufibacter roseolus TaxID=2817375 RepID=UPI001B315058|nr:hypothetical protein [Rufibacter roseolus]